MPAPMTRAEARKPSGFVARSRKAFVAGIVGAAGGITSTLPAALADAAVTWAEVAAVATMAIGGFVLGFATVWAMPNAD